MKLTKYKQTHPGVYERKINWLERYILGRNSYLRIWIRKNMVNEIKINLSIITMFIIWGLVAYFKY